MPLILRIKKTQLEKAKSHIMALRENYKTPMARLQTDQDGWVVEVEHLEEHGLNRINELENAAKQVGDELEVTVSIRTGAKKRKQYHLSEVRNGTYAVQVRVRDQGEANYFRR